jgi:hypothetical protein
MTSNVVKAYTKFILLNVITTLPLKTFFIKDHLVAQIFFDFVFFIFQTTSDFDMVYAKVIYLNIIYNLKIF